MKKPKFKPQITRVKLNPEQAVLSCNCYSVGMRYWTLDGQPGFTACKIWSDHSKHMVTCGEAHANASSS